MTDLAEREPGTFIALPNDTCKDYACEARGSDHSHIGEQPYLRRMMSHGKLVDGKTGRKPR